MKFLTLLAMGGRGTIVVFHSQIGFQEVSDRPQAVFLNGRFTSSNLSILLLRLVPDRAGDFLVKVTF